MSAAAVIRARVDSAITFSRGDLSRAARDRLRTALSFANPVHQQRLRMGRRPGDEPETICVMEELGGEIRIPRGAVALLREVAALDGRAVAFEDARGVPDVHLALPIVPLRDYQADVVRTLGARTQGYAVMPCGGGKTRTGIGAISRAATPALVLVHTLDLAQQWLDSIRELLGVEAGLVGDGEVREAPITVAVVQALVRWQRDRLDALLRGVGLLVVDECLPGDMRVIVRGRGAVPIRDCVRMADDVEVLSFSHEGGTAEFKRVTARSSKTVRRRMVTLHVRRGQRTLTLRLTEEHPVFVEGRGYVRAIDVQQSDQVVALAHFYPCPECTAAFEVRGALGGHVLLAHRCAGRPINTRSPGGACPHCGKVYATKGMLRTHVRRHEDAVFDKALRENISKRMRATNLRRSTLLRERMRETNPARDPVVREKIRRALQQRPASAYDHLDGGNGAGPTIPEQVLLDKLGPGWTWQHVVPTGRPRTPGIPTNYKIDIAHPAARIAVEVDGQSHRGEVARARDQRKDQWLMEHGWRCFRFRNNQVVADPNSIAKSLLEVLCCPA